MNEINEGNKKLDLSRRTTGVAHPVDVHVGSRLRRQRTLKGLSQGRLGEAVGLTFQQVQKYERGANRVGASRLFEIAQVLETPVSYFFEGLNSPPPDYSRSEEHHSMHYGLSDLQEEYDTTLDDKNETLELITAYLSIENASLRRKLLELAKLMAEQSKVSTEQRA